MIFPPSGADGSDDGFVDAADLQVWNDHFGESLTGGVVTATADAAPSVDVALLFAPGGSPGADLGAAVAHSTPSSTPVADRDARDALFAAGDVTALFTNVRSFRPLRRGRILAS